MSETSPFEPTPSEPGTDAGLLAPSWAGTPVEPDVSDEAWLAALVDVEIALARAQARLGLIPEGVADAIATAVAARPLDLVELARRARDGANPVVAFVKALTETVAAQDAAAAEYVHRGSTSQDVLDSAAMLITARVLTRLVDDLSRVAHALARLAEQHRDTVLAGRTLTQHAVPTTLGLKAAGWLHLVLDAVARTQHLLATGLPAQLGGAAGTLAAYAEYAAIDRDPGDGPLPGHGVELIAPFADALGLAEPVLPWHTLRTPIAEVGAVLSLVTGALGKFALDVQTMSRTELGEVAEPAAAGRGASSAMPQKRNPVLATLVVAAARQVPAHALVLAQSMLAEDERPAGAWHAEWQPLREALRLTGGAAHTAAELAEGLRVHPDRMLANLALTDGAIVAERLTVALAPVLGKAAAKQLLGEVTAAVAASGGSLAEALASHPLVAEHLSADVLADLLDPRSYLGAASELVDRELHRYRQAFGAE